MKKSRFVKKLYIVSDYNPIIDTHYNKMRV
jgi:hypothetical protein